MNRRILTIALTTIDGFQSWMAKHSRAEVVERLEQNERLLLPIIHHYEGQVVKTLGESFLLAFANATSAVSAAAAMQTALAAEPGALPLRIAIDTGEVEVLGSEEVIRDLHGSPIDIASRLERIAEPGAVYITDATRQAMTDALESEPVSEFDVPGRSTPLTVYRVDATVDIPPVGHSATISGELSHALLYEHERAALRGARFSPFAWAALAAVILTLGMGGYFGVSRMLLDREIQNGRAYLEAANPGAAYDLAAALREKHADHRVVELMNDAMVARVVQLCEAGEVEQADAFLTGVQTSYSSLASMHEAQREVDVARMFNAQGRGFVDRIFHQEILNKYPNDPVVRERFVEWYLELPANWRDQVGVLPTDSATSAVKWLVEHDDSYLEADWFEPVMIKAVHNAQRSETNHVLDFWLQFGRETLDPILVAGLYATEKQDAPLRWSAKLYVEKEHPELLDEFRFNAIEFVAGSKIVRSHYHDIAKAYFLAQVETRGVEATRARVDFPLPHPDVLDRTYREDDAAFTLYADVFADAQRDLLTGLVTEPSASPDTRSKALAVLTRKGWVTAELRSAFHATNLQTVPWTLSPGWQALGYFADEGVPTADLGVTLRQILADAESKGHVDGILRAEKAIARLP